MEEKHLGGFITTKESFTQLRGNFLGLQGRSVKFLEDQTLSKFD